MRWPFQYIIYQYLNNPSENRSIEIFDLQFNSEPNQPIAQQNVKSTQSLYMYIWCAISDGLWLRSGQLNNPT